MGSIEPNLRFGSISDSELGEHTRLGCGWPRLAVSIFARETVTNPRIISGCPDFSRGRGKMRPSNAPAKRCLRHLLTDMHEQPHLHQHSQCTEKLKRFTYSNPTRIRSPYEPGERIYCFTPMGAPLFLASLNDECRNAAGKYSGKRRTDFLRECNGWVAQYAFAVRNFECSTHRAGQKKNCYCEKTSCQNSATE